MEVNILDDRSEVMKIDKGNYLLSLENFPNMIRDTISLFEEYSFPKEYHNFNKIIFAGMGGSAIGGEIIRDILLDKLSIPIIIHKDYWLPNFVNKDDLVFIISYSGDTEETLSSFINAYNKKSKIIIITSDGLLLKLAQNLKIPLLEIPKGFQPRAALPYLFSSILLSLNNLGIKYFSINDLLKASYLIDKLKKEINIDSPLSKNIAKKIAKGIFNSFPVIYSSIHLKSVAYRFKTQLNEVSKNFCRVEYFPELCHNEVVAWMKKNKLENSSIILFRSNFEPPYITEKISYLIEEVKNIGINNFHEIKARGNNYIEEVLSSIYIGDFISFYLAIINKIDPSLIDIIYRFKEKSKFKEEINKIVSILLASSNTLE
ncbi:MAG: bifunctional phosphoglucose/phosphomannose isomerase [Nitrososphaerota archaeon]